jgi:polyribonucleotide nucleotidyltransferase
MDSINMKNYHKATIIMTFGSVTGDAVLKAYSGATAAAKTSAIPFQYAITEATIGSSSGDVLGSTGTAVAASGLTLTAASVGSAMVVVEIDAAAMDIANAEEFLTLNVSNAASSGIMHAVAILEPRYKGNTSPTALA